MIIIMLQVVILDISGLFWRHRHADLTFGHTFSYPGYGKFLFTVADTIFFMFWHYIGIGF